MLDDLQHEPAFGTKHTSVFITRAEQLITDEF